ncbi:MAG: DJ-1/PfpI family protein [Eubacterium sp.]|nr:DJ-1/PfpI family protein [Eubacterium sp.]
MKKVYAFLADGLEEVEALMVIDLLRRTKKLDVVMVSIKDDLLVEGSHNIKIMADATIDEINFDEGDCIFLPGGIPGTPNLAACDKLTEQIKKYNEEGKLLAAICAAPSILSDLGLLKDVKATSYPSFEEQMDCKEYGGKVVRDANFITGKGLGVAIEEGLEIISYLIDEETSKQVADAIQFS